MTKKDLKLKDIIILYDRDSGISLFQDFRGYDDPIDDAEWILERNPKTKGFILRPVSQEDKEGIWIGEYTHNGNTITRYEVLNDKEALETAELMARYAQRRIAERNLIGKLNIKSLKEKLRSPIVRDFKYYRCPVEHFYYTCNEVKKTHESLKEKYGDRKTPYSKVADDIPATAQCSEAVICPLKATNAFEKIYNLDRALRNRGLGEITFISPGIVQVN